LDRSIDTRKLSVEAAVRPKETTGFGIQISLLSIMLFAQNLARERSDW